MATAEPRPASELPALYRSPWRTLAEALGAVSADLRLSLRRLWRRNLEGDLPRPGFWPAGLAAVFWPLLLVLLVAALLVLGGWGLGLRSPAQAPAPSEAAPGPEPAALATPAPALEWGSGSGLSGAAPAQGPTAAASASRPQHSGGAGPADVDRFPLDREHPREEASGPEPGTGSGRVPEGAASAPSPALRLDPLLELFGQGEDAALLVMARPDPSASRLSLALSPVGAALPDRQLLERAERWQQLARDAGYERLELRDPLGRLRGRSVVVGSGMILLAPGSVP